MYCNSILPFGSQWPVSLVRNLFNIQLLPNKCHQKAQHSTNNSTHHTTCFTSTRTCTVISCNTGCNMNTRGGSHYRITQISIAALVHCEAIQLWLWIECITAAVNSHVFHFLWGQTNAIQVGSTCLVGWWGSFSVDVAIETVCSGQEIAHAQDENETVGDLHFFSNWFGNQATRGNC